MSSAKGNTSRNRPQKYQNRTAFKNDLHDKSNKTKQINSLQINGVCQRCKEKIEWKIKYKKYKPLTMPKKCTRCNDKCVKHAYHVICTPCALRDAICSKCLKPEEIKGMDGQIETLKETELQSLIKSLPERKRRTIIRFMNKQAGSGKDLSAETGTEHDLLKKIEQMKLSAVKNEESSDGFDSDSEISESDLD